LSDFGLSTGFHKTHDSQFYQRLLDGQLKGNSGNSNSHDGVTTLEAGVDAINLTFSSKDKLATWKKNRRTLVSYFFFFPLPFFFWKQEGQIPCVTFLAPREEPRLDPSGLIFFSSFFILTTNVFRLIPPWARLTTLHPRSFCSRAMDRSVIGGPWEQSCLNAWSDTHHFAVRTHMRLTARS